MVLVMQNVNDRLYICHSCRDEVDPDDPDVLVAYEQKETTGFGESRQYQDGLGAHFHEGCFRIAGAGFRRADE